MMTNAVLSLFSCLVALCTLPTAQSDMLKAVSNSILVRNSVDFHKQFRQTVTKSNVPKIGLDFGISYDDLNLTELCKSHVGFYTNSLMNSTWAMTMFDAGTKIPEGLLDGHFQHLGHFDECIGIRSVVTETGVFHGQHCLATLNLGSSSTRAANAMLSALVPIKIAKCVPSSCSPDDVALMAEKDLSIMKLLLTSMSMEVTVTVNELECHTADEPELTAKDWVAVGVLIFFAILVVLSTSYDILNRNKDSRSNLVLAFSVYTNGKRLLSTSQSGDILHCLQGIRFLSMAWVVLAHRYLTALMGPSTNMLTYFDEFLPDWRRLGISNGQLSVDTFFFLSGLVCAYVFFRTVPKTNSFNIPLYYIHRYIRLTPVFAIMIMLQTTLWKYMGSGPLWDSNYRAAQKVCEEKWWINLLYVQNYAKLPDQCLGQSWYLAVDMQLHWLSPVVLIPLWKWPKIGWILMGGLMIGGAVTNFVISYVNEYPGNYFGVINLPDAYDYMKRVYWPVYARFMPYLIGIALGYALVQIKAKGQKIQLSKWMTLLLWLIGAGLMLLTLCIVQVFQERDYEYEPVGAAFYNALGRPGWALGVGIIVFLCATGYGGFANTILSWEVFQVLSRLSYSIYLVHQSLQLSQFASTRVSFYLSDMYLIPQFVADLGISIIFAVPLCLVFESPFIILEKELLGGKKTTHPKNQPAISVPEHGNEIESSVTEKKFPEGAV